MNIILFGPPGAGKGTQAHNLVKDFNLYKISTGDLLREEINKKNSLGLKIKSFIDKGSFVPDYIIDNLIENILSNKQYSNKVIFDGYPRNLDQAKNLDKIIKKNNSKINCVLSLNVDDKTVLKRILGRQICNKCGLIFNKYFNPADQLTHKCDLINLQIRTDDNEETIKSRLDTYKLKTLPILNYYKNQNLLSEIDGTANIVQIYSEIRHIIHSLEG